MLVKCLIKNVDKVCKKISPGCFSSKIIAIELHSIQYYKKNKFSSNLLARGLCVGVFKAEENSWVHIGLILQ